MFKHLSLSKKIGLIPLVILLLMGLLLGFSGYWQQLIGNKARAFTSEIAPVARLSGELANNALERQVSLRAYVETHSADDLAAYQALAKANQALLARPESSQLPTRSQLESSSRQLDDLFLKQLVPMQQTLAQDEDRILNQLVPQALAGASDLLASLDASTAGALPTVTVAFMNHLQASLIALLGNLNTPSATQLDRFLMELYGAENALLDLQHNIHKEDQQALLGQIASQLKTYHEQGQALFTRDAELHRLLTEQVAPTTQQIVSLSTDSQQGMWQRLNSESQAIVEDLGQIQTTSLLFGLFVVGLSLLSYWVILGLIRQPINQMVHAMEDIAEGEGDLTRRLDVDARDELGQMAGAFNRFVARLQETVQTIHRNVTSLNQSASTLTGLASQSEQQADHQRSEFGHLREQIDHLSSSFAVVADNMQQTAQSADAIGQASDEGHLRVRQTEQTITALTSQIEDTAHTMQQLAQDSQNATQVLDVIRGIAEQTNLLALNAAIEAARAGDQGRGFAVVADEVRTLAMKTQESTSHINDLLQSLISGANAAQEKMQQSQQQATASLAQMHSMSASVSDTHRLVQEIGERVQQVNQASNQQSDTTEQAARRMQALTSAVSASWESARGTAQSARAVTQQAEEIRQHLSHFRV
ncbi:methyl-accepting chemotaxis protein [Aeromonas sp. RU39B]|uniref:methyl-accepting chemotaxis protein n=1 Tax=Aeromonas sp. RU39B TaxID=1907416 RepID=UPI00095658D1|nr:methyl-accepting chemotaxis protein [Aeromonas sp. RU39B]SIQ98805.1 methyl-accepting chemotaxis protein [Aeromonas sp. RU39B]